MARSSRRESCSLLAISLSIVIEDFNRPPFTARARMFANDTYNFLGLYVTTLFSVCAMLLLKQNLLGADGK